MIKRFLPRGLLGRSLLIVAAPIVLAQAVTAIVFLDRHWDEMTARLASALAGEVAWVADALDDGADARWLFARAQSDFALACGLTPRGAMYATDPEASRPRLFWGAAVHDALSDALVRALGGRAFRVTRLDLRAKRLELLVELGAGRGALRVSASTSRLFSSSAYIFLMWMAGSSVVLLVVAVLFMRGQVRPIRRLAVAAERFGRGREVPSFSASGAKEVRQATAAFFAMHRRISRYVEQRTAMLAGVSHDLGTMLARLKLGLAMLPDGADVNALRADVVAMEKMLAGYLDFARGEGGEAFARTDLAAMLRDLAGRQAAPVEVADEGDVWASVRPVAMARALGNLLANAAQHGARVWASVTREREDRIVITIDDDGPGIPAERREDAFRPFVRLDSARGVEGGGTGLGLAIVRDIVHAHGGRTFLGDSLHGGVRVTIRLPV